MHYGNTKNRKPVTVIHIAQRPRRARFRPKRGLFHNNLRGDWNKD